MSLDFGVANTNGRSRRRSAVLLARESESILSIEVRTNIAIGRSGMEIAGSQ